MLPIRIKACSESDLRMLGDLAHNIQRVLPVTQADIDAAAALGKGWVVWKVVEVTDPLDNCRGGTQLVIKQNSIQPGQNVRRVLIVSGPSGQVVVVGPDKSPLLLPDAVADSLQYLKAYGDCENRNLPEGYQELEYIEGLDNTQYINTGIVPTANMKIYAKFSLVSGALNSWSPFGARKTTGGDDGLLFFGGATNNTRIDLNWLDTTVSTNRWRIDNVCALGDVFEYKIENSLAEVIKNGTSLGTHQFTPDATCDQAIYINGMNNAGTPLTQTSMTLRQYRFIIYGIADMRPARRLSDGELGMYDTIRKRFFTNAGTGSFIAGVPLTLPEGYTRIEYIEGMANVQYINTGIVMNSNMEIYCKAEPLRVISTGGGSYTPFGARDTASGNAGFLTFFGPINTNMDWWDSTRWTEAHGYAGGFPATVIEISVKNSLATLKYDGNTKTHQFTPTLTTTSATMWINGLNNGGTPWTTTDIPSRIYRFTIDGVADFVPARRDSDGAIGMFNVLNNQFYGNAGTGTFTAGGVVAPTPTKPADIWCNNGAIKAIRPIKYLESTGTQYIDTGVVPSINTKLVVKALARDITTGQIAGCRPAVNENNLSLRYANDSGVASYFADFNNSAFATYRAGYPTSTPSDVILEASKAKRAVYAVDGTILAENTTEITDTFNFTLSMYLFGVNGMATLFSGRIYSAQIYDGATLIRDMIPALDANNIPCMFDKVEGKCYYNAGTGQFIAGYLPAEYEELEYIQGYTGNSSVDPSIKAAYIDTGIIFDTTVNMYYKGGIGGFNTNSVLAFGARPSNAYSGLSSYFSGIDVVTDWGGTDASGRWTLPLDLIAGDTFEVSTNNKTMTISKNGVVAGTHTFTGTATNGLSFYLNSRHDLGGVPSQSSPSIGRLYRFTVAGVCDMIPARKRSNGHIGMYDLVRRQFFENAGEGQFTVGKLPILPETYTQLDYIESTGTQYLNTGVANNQAASYDITVQATQAPETGRAFLVFGSRNGSTVANITSTLSPTSACSDFGDYNSTRLNPTIDYPLHKLRFVNSATDRTITDLDTGTVYSSTSVYTGTFTGSTTLRIGEVTTGGAATWDNFVGKIFECKVYQNDILVKYLIPAKRNSDGVVGMYDIMNDVFHTNQGTGTFAYGAEIPTETFTGYYVDGVVEKVGTRSAGNKNLFNGVFEQGGLYQGNLVVADTRIRTPDYITFPAGTYTISCASAYEVWIEKNDTSSVNWYSSYTFTATSTNKFKIAVRSKTDPSTTIIRPDAPVNVQVEAGSTATAYVPYCDGGLTVCENLLGIGSTQDVQEILTGSITRKIGFTILDGSENWVTGTNGVWCNFQAEVGAFDPTAMMCTHYAYAGAGITIINMQQNQFSGFTNGNIAFKGGTETASATAFRNWLREQYDNGTPVMVVFILGTAQTESVAGQTLTVSAGNNTAEIMQASIDGLMLEAEYTKSV